jgi:hypothetical protein
MIAISWRDCFLRYVYFSNSKTKLKYCAAEGNCWRRDCHRTGPFRRGMGRPETAS